MGDCKISSVSFGKFLKSLDQKYFGIYVSIDLLKLCTIRNSKTVPDFPWSVYSANG